MSTFFIFTKAAENQLKKTASKFRNQQSNLSYRFVHFCLQAEDQTYETDFHGDRLGSS
jgi:hypothetical protein